MNSNSSAKSRGVVIFAFNTSSTDYVKIADRTSRLISQHLQLPITLITDVDSTPVFEYDQVIRVDSSGSTFRNTTDYRLQQWRNFDRYLAYELSPYYETILIDTDYLVLDDSLIKLFATEFDYKLMHHSKNIYELLPEEMGATGLPFVWATVVLFRKTERTRLFFNLIGRIQRNYNYYSLLYNIREGNYRNDYAFAIANNILNGYSLNEDQSIPWQMLTIEKPIERITVTNSQIRIYHANLGIVLPRQNIHVMDKEYLLSNNFEQAVEAICEPT